LKRSSPCSCDTNKKEKEISLSNFRLLLLPTTDDDDNDDDDDDAVFVVASSGENVFSFIFLRGAFVCDEN